MDIDMPNGHCRYITGLSCNAPVYITHGQEPLEGLTKPESWKEYPVWPSRLVGPLSRALPP